MISIVGGAKAFHRDIDQAVDKNGKPAYLERADGGWFDFSFLFREDKGKKKPLELIAYNAEIRILRNGTRWFRLDLNVPGHTNEERWMRSHCHPSGCVKDENDSHALAHPILSPLELLDVMVFGFRDRAG
ncbi:MAG: hypothetical protein U0165_07190 [Polyangiaceae bacterium]